jgi:hypothetical protein
MFAKEWWWRIRVSKGCQRKGGYDDGARKEEAEGSECRLKAGCKWYAVVV